MKISSLLLLIVLTGSMKAKAQDKSNDTSARYFITQASIGNLQEIEIGKLALEKGLDQRVKDFAGKMVRDHTVAQTELMQLIKSGGYQIPGEATSNPPDDLMLKNMSGKDFDREYVHMMVPDHRETVQLFEKYALTGKDPVVREFAVKTLPILKEHLAAIIAIDNSMKDAVYLQTLQLVIIIQYGRYDFNKRFYQDCL